ncbi:hypothetical protein BLA29_000297 [Euroglyphus maynei]|uniref:Partial AB-hydrolase lipase domain-containing protein n=1 Tax=Euroglyphus maynei TaxID=6958 RepID=A0A1Y3AY77_EURMA|nr:hypothetical protein BLA29_000297 [Euroglyphus maynei]
MSFVQLNRLLCDILIFIILANYAESALPFFDDENPDLMMTTNVTAMDNADVDRDIIIHSRGFESERHFITTSDGYILQLVRIINPMTIDRRNELKPIVLFHGFQCTGSFWIITAAGRLMNDGNYYEYDENGHLRHNDTDMTVGNTLGFVLANRGYDGNFIMLALLSTRPEYSQKIRPYIALSPVFYTDKIKTPLRFYGPLKEVLR